MELHKNSCWWLLSIFVISLLLYIASAISHPTISNVFLALFTGAFVSISVSLTNYFHIKKEFFNRLFFYGAIINKEFENIKQLTEYVNSNIDYKNVISLIIAHSETINNHIHNIDFMTYSPFVGFLKEAEYVKNIGEMLSQYKLNLSIEILKIDLANRENEINILKNIIDENAAPEIINNLKTFGENVGELQFKFIEKMNPLHKITKNKLLWEQAIKITPENVSENIKKYILK